MATSSVIASIDFIDEIIVASYQSFGFKVGLDVGLFSVKHVFNTYR
jgi:hypothetical protein